MAKKVLLYSYSACTTCKKALRWLSENKIEFSVVDIIKTPPNKEILIRALDQFENRKSLFNTSGLSYRNLGAKVVQGMNDAQIIEALIADGKLIKRPFLITKEEKILVGFRPDVWEETLLD